ncbi:MAG TPA: hypothetical protein VHQ46_01100 [Desulfobacteria bacterium]|nr:hypothetical protein [Desulfobacteria bacterium]
MLKQTELEDAVRFTLGLLTGIADKVKEVQPLKEGMDQPEKGEPVNLLDENYRRGWLRYPVVVGMLYLGYRVWLKDSKK